MYTYIKHSVKEKFVQLETELSSDLYNIGTTWLDYVNGKWVLLSDEQVAYREANPTSTPNEVWYMRPTPTPTRTLEQAKREMNTLISNEMNDRVTHITYDGQSAYIDRQARLYAKDSAELASANNISTFQFNDNISIDSSMVSSLVNSISQYEADCEEIKNTKIAEMNELTTVEEVDAYDYQTGFPEKLNITASSLTIQNTNDKKANMQDKLVMLLSKQINNLDLTDEEAYQVKEMYPTFESLIGQSVSAGIKLQYNDDLYKVLSGISSLSESQKPDMYATMFEIIEISSAGTTDDPIAYNNNMVLVEGKYYIQNGVLYLCTASTTKDMGYKRLMDLVGTYTEIAE